MPKEIALQNRQVRLVTPLGPKKAFLMRAEIAEAISQMTDTDLQFLSPDLNLDIGQILGRKLSVEIDTEDGSVRAWHGHCINCHFEGLYEGMALFRAELRPWIWFLTLSKNCRIFQQMTTIEILKKIFGDAGFSDYRVATRETYAKRPYTIQFRESDYDFINRLMEEDGIYWFSEYDQSKETLVIADDIKAHKPLPQAEVIDFFFKEESYRRDQDHIFEWFEGENVTTGKVALNSYNFETPTASMKTVVAIPQGSHPKKDVEEYDFAGDYTDTEDGKRLARVRQQANACLHQRARGTGNVRTLATGGTFTLAGHPRSRINQEYLIIAAKHALQIETDYDEEGQARSRHRRDGQEEEVPDTYRCEFEVLPKGTPFRAPLQTEMPRLYGVYSALVVGPSGEEIYTDKYGRVKVKFPWDVVGASDDTAMAIWARVALPWTGSLWGWQSVPRIGMEVVVQFENGHPDFPVVTGMRYNGRDMPPWELPANMTQTGIKTNSSKGGGGYHELCFEDKKGEEFVRFQSEKDYMATIKNNATVSVGFEKADPGDYTEKIKNHMTTEIESGNHTFTVKSGKQTVKVKQDRELTVEGNETVKISKNKNDTISQNYSIDVGPNLTIKAKSKIVIECGGSKIEMTPGSIKITSPQIEVNASMSLKAEGGMSTEVKGGMTLKAEGGLMTEVKGGMMLKAESDLMTEVKGGALTTIKGGLIMIG